MEPTVFDNLSRFLRHVVIAHHHIRALKADFTDSVFVFILDFDFHAGKNMAYGRISHIFMVIRIQRSHWRTLCESVSLYRNESKVVEELQNCRVDGRTAGYKNSHSASEYLENIL